MDASRHARRKRAATKQSDDLEAAHPRLGLSDMTDTSMLSTEQEACAQWLLALDQSTDEVEESSLASAETEDLICLLLKAGVLSCSPKLMRLIVRHSMMTACNVFFAQEDLTETLAVSLLAENPALLPNFVAHISCTRCLLLEAFRTGITDDQFSSFLAHLTDWIELHLSCTKKQLSDELPELPPLKRISDLACILISAKFTEAAVLRHASTMGATARLVRVVDEHFKTNPDFTKIEGLLLALRDSHPVQWSRSPQGDPLVVNTFIRV